MDIKITFSWSPLFLIAVIIIIGGFTFWIYRHTIPPVSGYYRGLLIFFRIAALVILGFILFGPVLHITTTRTKQPDVGLLIDASASMQIADDEKMRGETIRELLQSDPIKNLENRYRLMPYLFAENATVMEPFNPDSLAFNGFATDIAQAIRTIQENKGERILGGVLLISDGVYNSGENPLREIEDSDFPIYTVVIGDTLIKPDIILNQTMTNEITYVGNRVPVELSIRGPGFSGRRISLRLLKTGEILDQAVVTIPPHGREISHRLHFSPQEPGFDKMMVEITQLDGELTFVNNRRELYVKVLKSKFRVLLAADAPSPDFSFIKRLLSKDENIELITRTQKYGGSYYEGAFPGLSELRSIDLVILMGVPSRTTPRNTWNQLAEIFRNTKKPLFILTNNSTDNEKLRDIEALLPFSQLQHIQELSVVPRLTREGGIHPVTRVDENWESNASAWHHLPPLYSVWNVTGMRPGCQVVVKGMSEQESLTSTPEGQPLIMIRHVGGAKSLVVLGPGLYRWVLLMWGTGGTNTVLETFIGNAVRWLVTREEEKPVRFSTNKAVYRSGEGIIFSAQVYDEMYRPVEKALVTVTVKSSSDSTTEQLIDTGEGRYQKVSRYYESGTYHAEAEAVLHERLLGRDRIEFSVSAFNPEFLDNKANPDLMEGLAQMTGGTSGPPDSLSSIVEAMRFPPQNVRSSQEIALYDPIWMMAAIILLLSGEWFIRKRKGMV